MGKQSGAILPNQIRVWEKTKLNRISPPCNSQPCDFLTLEVRVRLIVGLHAAIMSQLILQNHFWLSSEKSGPLHQVLPRSAKPSPSKPNVARMRWLLLPPLLRLHSRLRSSLAHFTSPSVLTFFPLVATNNNSVKEIWVMERKRKNKHIKTGSVPWPLLLKKTRRVDLKIFQWPR